MYLAKFGHAHFSESLLSFGWSHPEHEWVWSEGEVSVLTVRGVAYASCRIRLEIEAPRVGGAESVFRVSVNGVDHGVRSLAPGVHEIVLTHEASSGSKANGLVIVFFHDTCSAPAEVDGVDGRRINIALKTLAIEPIALRQRQDIACFKPGEPIDAFYVKREHDAYARETHQKVAELNAIAKHGPGRAMEFYLYGLGGNRHDRQALWRGLLACPAAKDIPPGDLGEPGAERAMVERFAPDFLPVLLKPHDGDGVEARIVGPAIDNPLYDPAPLFPDHGHLGWMFKERRLPVESLFCAQGAEVIATPRQFLVFDPVKNAYFPPRGNSAGLTQLSTAVEIVTHEGAVVIAGDEFDDSNIAHFLFDCCLRVASFCVAYPQLKAQALFVMNGRPTGLHKLAVAALCRLNGLSEGQILFPRQPVRIRPAKGVYWSSDLTHDRHPCQRFRPEALAIFTALTRDIAGRVEPSSHRAAKIFISRTDAHLRRLANEDALVARLATLGVRRVVMSQHSWEEQIDIVANADLIVGPHGMGLTHAAFNFRKPRLIEIFHPSLCSAAYAVMAKAYGMDYTPLFGVETDPAKVDYAIAEADIETIARLVAA